MLNSPPFSWSQIIAGSDVIVGSTLQMRTRQKTFAIAVSREMSPTSKIVVYCVTNREIIMDSITFYVDDGRLLTVSTGFDWDMIYTSTSYQSSRDHLK
jgi:hypothetical protein